MKTRFMTLLAALLIMVSSGCNAQTATEVLQKTASVVGRKGGCSAHFTLSSEKYGKASGSLAIKGNKFNARTDKATVWYNGKTQWSYMKSTNEVNVSNPTQAQQMSMNPMTFINIYKTGYNSSMTANGAEYVVHLTAQNTKRSVQEMYITINKKTYVPTKVRMRQGKSWSDITISQFKAQNQPNSTFSFNAKDFPTAEVVDLR